MNQDLALNMNKVMVKDLDLDLNMYKVMVKDLDLDFGQDKYQGLDLKRYQILGKVIGQAIKIRTSSK